MATQYGFDTIHVIESLKESDGEPGRRLTENWNRDTPEGIQMVYHFVLSRDDLFREMDAIYAGVSAAVPVLHFELHGNDEGFGLRDDSFVSWEEFGPHLLRFNLATRFNLLVTFSCCFGIHQIVAMSAFKPAPFVGVVGCDREAETPELLNGFEAFYRTLVATDDGHKALAALQGKIFSGAQFAFFTVEKAFRGAYKNVVRENRARDPFKLRRKQVRKELAQKARAAGRANPKVTDWQIKAALAETEGRTLRQFYEAFFALDQISENERRFPYDLLIAGL
ncbi:hypothetical protein [Opitutus sp. GAS368]|uniref:hypothetical protein n=1 Tax=Opitutus sp. GAS368 TaxID=1882749 RepID=UPI00087A06EC|nr:hypothetical protein [Opitutus sp. GAS368]SDS02048.1 hypothetical protein SAMN05444173_1646 [Opitutus sp. GAS368]